ncbi:hypothetical protein D3C73_1453110 [compost metagenome]
MTFGTLYAKRYISLTIKESLFILKAFPEKFTFINWSRSSARSRRFWPLGTKSVYFAHPFIPKMEITSAKRYSLKFILMILKICIDSKDKRSLKRRTLGLRIDVNITLSDP